MQIIAPEEAGFSAARLRRINVAMQHLVDQGTIAGGVTLVARHGGVAHFEAHGLMDIEAGKPMRTDTIFRFYSMTKPVTAVATMMLYEEGYFLLEDPIADFIPEFAQTKVLVGEAADGETTRLDLADLERPITIRHLLMHTSGVPSPDPLGTPLERMYAQEQIWRPDETLEQKVRRMAKLPLAHQPGRGWTYGFYGASFEVLARLVEVVSGQAFDIFLKERIFDPLGMADTGFYVPSQSLDRLAAMYTLGAPGRLQRDESPHVDRSEPVAFLSGAGGLNGTPSDFARFAQMLLGGGELDGVRLLGRKTVELMTASHLSQDNIPFPPSTYPFNVGLAGHSMALGVAVLVDFGVLGSSRSVGSYTWAGAASTDFWVDPKEDLIGLIMLQLLPFDVRPLKLFDALAYQALV